MTVFIVEPEGERVDGTAATGLSDCGPSTSNRWSDGTACDGTVDDVAWWFRSVSEDLLIINHIGYHVLHMDLFRNVKWTLGTAMAPAAAGCHHGPTTTSI